MEFMNLPGFFGTRALMFMDIVSLIVIFLPFLMYGVIYLAKIQKYELHAKLQVVLYIVSVLVLTFFEIGVRNVGGFSAFMKESSVSHNYALIVLIFHIFISVSTLLVWSTTLFKANTYLATNRAKHKKLGYLSFVGVILTALTGGWVYALLFVY